MPRRLPVFILCLLAAVQGLAQMLTGRVTDARTGEVLPTASLFYSRGEAWQTDLNGTFRIPFRRGKLSVSLLGYKTQTLRPAAADTLDVRLEPADYTDLSEATVTRRKSKYSRKDNPAVALMRKVIAAKQASDLRRHDYYSVERYRRTTYAFNEVTEKVFQEGKFKRFPFLKDHVETCTETGKLVLPISIDEEVTQDIYRKSPESLKTLVKGKQTQGLTKLFSTGDMLVGAARDCFTDVNIYDDKIRLLRATFTSPLSTSAAIGFYRFFIADTLSLDSVRAIRVDFTPNNSQDLGFSGSLYVAADSTCRVLRADMGIPARHGVNFVDDMRIIQDFRRLPTGEQVLVRDNMIVQLSIVDFLQKAMVKRVTEYGAFDFSPRPAADFDFRGERRELPEADRRNADFWAPYRGETLTASERGLGSFMQKLMQLKGFKPVLWVAKAFIENYVETTTNPDKRSKVDFGPVNTTISHNFVDGLRLRLSAQTTTALHPHLFLRGYVAYGFKDRKFKGLGEVTWSFNQKKDLCREFPVNNLTFNYSRDVMSPSDKFLYTDKDNVFTSFKWTRVDHMMYYERFNLLYDREWENNVRLKLQLSHTKDTPTAALFYLPLSAAALPAPDALAGCKRHLSTTDLTVSLTYQPGATWLDTKQRRFLVNRNSPVYGISHTVGVKGLLGTDYTYNFTELTLYQRLRLGRSWGRIDLMAKGGIQWNKVPFPLLIMPAANLSYILSDNTFTLIDNMEFPNDRYASLMMSWDMNGKIFNRIPLFKRLKWRELIGVNMLWGTLTDKNNPLLAQNAGSPALFHFPGTFAADGTYTYLSRPMNPRTPYVEVVAGIHNIFKILQVEYVRRLTYTRHMPERRKWGIRLALSLRF